MGGRSLVCVNVHEISLSYTECNKTIVLSFHGVTGQKQLIRKGKDQSPLLQI